MADITTKTDEELLAAATAGTATEDEIFEMGERATFTFNDLVLAVHLVFEGDDEISQEILSRLTDALTTVKAVAFILEGGELPDELADMLTGLTAE